MGVGAAVEVLPDRGVEGGEAGREDGGVVDESGEEGGRIDRR
jgi:hypothetical protein